MSSHNPLLTLSPLRNHAPQFDLIKEDHFKPAVEAAIAEARANIDKIINNTDAPTFENTIVALETSSETLGTVTSIFYNQLSAAGTDGLQALAEEIGPIQANFGSDIILNADLFKRVKTVYDAKDTLGLSTEQHTLLDDTYKNFVRGGALLDVNKKAELRKINEAMSTLSPAFSNNVKKSSEKFEMWINDEKDLAGLPQTAIDGAKYEAEQKSENSKWLFTLDFPSFGPFLTYSSVRPLREKIWRAFSSRAYGDEFDNTETIFKIVKLRNKRARLLGYDTHAHYTLERRMAEKPETVMAFLKDLKGQYRVGALKDLEDIKQFARETDGIEDLMPWDVGYYSEKLKEKLYHFSDEDLRPYFPLDRVLKGTFDHFSKLFGLIFAPAKDLPTWHADVTAYDVTDKDTGEFIGTFYTDFYPRVGKKPGAWMTSYRDRGLFHGEVAGPVVAIVCNFTKPTGDKQPLLTFDEVETLFHEMGHATHGLLAKGTYASQSGTNVLWDFVELPSQLQENWLYEPETLNSFAAHYETGAPIPADLIEKMRAAKNFLSGWMGVRQMGYSILDMEWHLRDPESITDIAKFEDEVMKDVRFFPRMGGTQSHSFSHIFAGGYSSGYYSYKWAEVLDADTFEAFLETGLYNPETAHRYRTEILEKGGSEHPAILYRNFRGRDADPNALLRRDGLLQKAG
ncbi:MAG: M3 family metallopeptidase [Pseudobdellovibrionaceae bacterium]|jgi:peptidyl-dipeptidase Dcp|nr:M3 family metallopeptidase [Pseudobdellovibrionaceae bacterium]